MANFVGNNQDNTLVGTPEDDSFQARGGNDTVRGRGGNDTIDAGSGADTARGGGGNDTIAGATGGDLLNGDTGDNNLIGGPGPDTFEVDIGTGGGGTDSNVIADFQNGVDQIHLEFNGAPLGTARVNAIDAAAGANNALDDPDPGVLSFNGFLAQGDAVSVSFLEVPNLNVNPPGDDFLTVVGVPQLDLDIQAGGTDLFLV